MTGVVLCQNWTEKMTSQVQAMDLNIFKLMILVQMTWTHWVHRYQVQDILSGTWKVHIRQSGQWDLVYSIHV